MHRSFASVIFWLDSRAPALASAHADSAPMDQLDLGNPLPLFAGAGGTGDAADVRAVGFAGVSSAASSSAPAAQIDFGPILGVIPLGAAAEVGEVLQEEGEQRHAPRKFEYRSADLTAHMRDARKMKQQQRRIDELEGQVGQAHAAMDVVTTLLPGVSNIVGRPGGAKAAKAVGRMHKLTPSNFLLLVRAAFLPVNSKITLGICHKRLVCAASKFILTRQALALRFAVRSCLVSLRAESASGAASQTVAHLSYMHMWDETLVRAGVRRAKKFRQTRLAVGAQTISQRGSVRFTLAKATGESVSFDEAWLCRPWQVCTTSAHALLPGLRRAMPSCFNFESVGEIKDIAASVSSFSFLPVCDKASGNLSILRVWGDKLRTMQEEEPSTKNILYLPEVCGVHTHHRGKLMVKGLREHTMRHFSIANLYRLQSIQSRMLSRLEYLVAHLVQRKVGPAPEGILTLRSAIDALYHLDAPHHLRGPMKGARSQRCNDLEVLASVVNGDLRSDQWVHHCWDADTCKPCCASKAETIEKSLVATTNALFGFSDPIPAESRWTSVLANLKQTVLRRLVFKVGTLCFDHVAASVPAPDSERVPEADDESVGAFLEHLRRTRIGKTAAYYSKDETFFELAVYVKVVDIYDGLLLYPVLGDPYETTDGERKECPVELLMNKENSSIARCMHELLVCLRVWHSDDRGAPWLLLDALQAPSGDPAFRRFARSQALLLSSSVFRRYEVKYSAWPYRLRALYDEPMADSTTVLAQELLASDTSELDPYSAGISKLFPSVEALLSTACQAVVRSDFSAIGYTTDHVERLHAEVTRTIVHRGSGQNFANLAREALLRQACAVHVRGGGEHPTRANKSQTPATMERAAAPPMLHTFAKRFAEGAIPLQGEDSEVLRDAPATQPAGSSHNYVSGGNDDELVIALQDQGFNEYKTTERPCKEALFSSSAPKSKAKAAGGQRAGLNPKMLELNKRMHAARQTIGRSLTKDEIAQVRADFAEFWENTADRDAHALAYAEWRSTTPESETLNKVGAFRTSWGGGCYISPISCDEFCQYQACSGWPSYDEVYDTYALESALPADEEVGVHHAANVRLWSVQASPRNVSRKQVPSPKQFDLVEKGLLRVLENVGRQRVGEGTTLVSESQQKTPMGR